MSIDFEYYETPDPSGKKSGKYHARAITLKTVSTEEVAETIHMQSSLTTGDVIAVLNALSSSIAYHLGNSERVHLEGIGYFQPTLKSDKEIDPKKTRAQSVWFKSVKFRADQTLKNKLVNIKTRRSENKYHSAALTNDKVDQMVARFFKKENFLTRRKLENICSMMPSTAARHLRRMKEEGKIKNINTRSQPIYMLPTSETD